MNKAGILMDYVIIYEEGENSCSAYVPDLPGCIAAGDIVDEVNSLISEAVEDSIVLQIKVSYDNPSQPITKYIKSDQIPDEMLPISGETLRLKTEKPFC
ncbi:type II toxin-antitoxin system HicB family antitoxin [Candidatus Poribacteria bacterium]|nr:type II toxin-antitoxin system HicB family antitoxin [Candidatus Poribacteria bacterium]